MTTMYGKEKKRRRKKKTKNYVYPVNWIRQFHYISTGECYTSVGVSSLWCLFNTAAKCPARAARARKIWSIVAQNLNTGWSQCTVWNATKTGTLAGSIPFFSETSRLLRAAFFLTSALSESFVVALLLSLASPAELNSRFCFHHLYSLWCLLCL